MSSHPTSKRPTGAAFLLAQLGAHAAQRFAERIAILGIAPKHAGILRIISATEDCSQQKLSEMLGVLPSTMVVLIDELDKKGLVQRHRSVKDRRNYALALTPEGIDLLQQLSRLAAEHEADLCVALNSEERVTFAAFCRRIADQQGLTPQVHPGYRNIEGAHR
jgi:DNA-binding MarR family transcriptional regulator